jgi:hypothetical protein
VNRRLAAYQTAMRITPDPSNVTEVIQRADRIIRWLTEGPELELRVEVLDTLTTALGVGPGRPPSARSVTRLPDADRLIDQARKLLTYTQKP